MKNLQLYERLLQFSLFQGMSLDDLQHMAAHTKFDFRKHRAGEVVYRAGMPCKHIYLLTHGTIKVTTSSDDGLLTVEETIAAPHMPQPERLFGVSQRFGSTIRAVSDINLVLIDKKEVTALLEQLLVFRINMINLFAHQSQRLQQQLWQAPPQTLHARIVRFFAEHCTQPEGEKDFRILMRHLAQAINASRLDVSKALNDMQDKGLLQLHRGRITIPAMEKLL